MTSQDEYIDAIRRYVQEIGQPEFVAPRDMMCEPHMIAKTGLRELFTCGRDAAAERVNAMLKDAQALPQLWRHDGVSFSRRIEQ